MDQALKELPITLDIEFTADFGHALPLCILASREKFQNWLFQNYMMPVIFYTGISQFDCLVIDSMQYGYLSKMPPSLMRFSFTGDEVMSHISDIVGLIRTRIIKGWYCILFLDCFYIQGTVDYQKNHYAHEILLYGYDDTKQIIQAVIFDNALKSIFIPYNDMEMSYREALTYVKDRPGWDEYMLMQIRPVDEHKEVYPFNVHFFIRKLKGYLNAQMEEAYYYNEFIYLKCEKKQCYPGIQMNRAVLEMVNELKNQYKQLEMNTNKYALFRQYHPLHTYSEFHKALVNRIQYFVSSYGYEDVACGIIGQYKEIALLCEKIRLLYIKINRMVSLKNDKGIEITLNKIGEYAEEIYLKEPVILSRLIKLIEK